MKSGGNESKRGGDSIAATHKENSIDNIVVRVHPMIEKVLFFRNILVGKIEEDKTNQSEEGVKKLR